MAQLSEAQAQEIRDKLGDLHDGFVMVRVRAGEVGEITKTSLSPDVVARHLTGKVIRHG